MNTALIIIVLIVVFIIFLKLPPTTCEPKSFKRYRQRLSARSIWEQRYLQNISIIERILHIFCESFGFWEHDNEEKFQFLPEDKPSDIYKEIYSKYAFGADGFEFESLVDGLEMEFHIVIMDFICAHPYFTLGELADYVLSTQQENDSLS